MVATSTGLVAFSGTRAGNAEAADFTPVSDYAGLTGSIRDKLTGMKVAPVKAEVGDDRPLLTPPTLTRPPTMVAGERAAAN